MRHPMRRRRKTAPRRREQARNARPPLAPHAYALTPYALATHAQVCAPVRASRTHTQALARKSAHTKASPRRLSNGDEYGRAPREQKGRAGRVAFCRRASLRAKKKYLLRRLPKAVFFCRKKHENGGCVKKDQKREKRGKRRRKRRKRRSKGEKSPFCVDCRRRDGKKSEKREKYGFTLIFVAFLGRHSFPFFSA